MSLEVAFVMFVSDVCVCRGCVCDDGVLNFPEDVDKLNYL